jgi:uroporphyrinogen-III synthase
VVLGHARLSNSTEGDRPPINGEVVAAFGQLVQQDYSAFIRHGLVQVTHGSIGDELAERLLEIVPPELAAQAWELAYQPDDMVAQLRDIDRPFMLADHAGCLVMTPEGFEDAVAAFPQAQTVSTADAPSVSEEFADALREFCLSVVAAEA